MDAGRDTPLVSEVRLVPIADLKPHEYIHAEHFYHLRRHLLLHGMRTPIIADRTTGIILDGHHRFTALKSLGARRVPVCHVDYDDERIVVRGWGDLLVTKEQVRGMAKSGALFPCKTTRHMFLLGEREVHCSTALPEVRFPLSEMYKER